MVACSVEPVLIAPRTTRISRLMAAKSPCLFARKRFLTRTHINISSGQRPGFLDIVYITTGQERK
jgi:hypothetical protein